MYQPQAAEPAGWIAASAALRHRLRLPAVEGRRGHFRLGTAADAARAERTCLADPPGFFKRSLGPPRRVGDPLPPVAPIRWGA